MVLGFVCGAFVAHVDKGRKRLARAEQIILADAGNEFRVNFFSHGFLGGRGGAASFCQGHGQFASVLRIRGALDVTTEHEGVHQLPCRLFGNTEFSHQLT